MITSHSGVFLQWVHSWRVSCQLLHNLIYECSILHVIYDATCHARSCISDALCRFALYCLFILPVSKPSQLTRLCVLIVGWSGTMLNVKFIQPLFVHFFCCECQYDWCRDVVFHSCWNNCILDVYHSIHRLTTHNSAKLVHFVMLQVVQKEKKRRKGNLCVVCSLTEVAVQRREVPANIFTPRILNTLVLWARSSLSSTAPWTHRE